MCLEEIVLRAQNMITVLGSVVNMIGDHARPFNEHEHFDNE